MLEKSRPATTGLGVKSGKQRATMFSVGGTSSYHPLPENTRVGTAQNGRRIKGTFVGGRPHTAAIIPGFGEPRPQTGAVPQAIFGQNSLANFGKPDRATSAFVFDNENLGRYEEII